MGWIGKIIGGTVGFMLGGPLGMIAGAVFGNVFDKAPLQGSDADGEGFSRGQQGQRRFGYQTGGSPFSSQGGSREQAQMVFFVGAFSMLARIASVDGVINTAERKKVEEFIRRDLRLDPQSSAIAIQVFETAVNSQGSFEQFAVQFYESFRMNHQMLELMIDIFYRVSYADGQISRAEEALIDRAGEIFRFTRDHMDSIRRRYGTAVSGSGGMSRSFAVLGLKPDASEDEIKKAYRKLVSEYHPDKIASKGLPEEFEKFAAEKFREIQAAYDELRVMKGL